MNLRRASPYLSVVAVAAPLAFSSPDSSVTSLRIAGGEGAYAVITRGCNGEVLTAAKAEYENAGMDLSHKFVSPVRIGARAGLIQPPGSSVTLRYVNPYVSLDWSGFSIGGGWVRSDRRLPDGGGEDYLPMPENTGSAHIRVGKKVYWSLSYLEGVPLATGGYGQTGLGVREGRLDFWLGAGVVPQDRPGFVVRADLRVAGGLSLGATGRLGSSEGISENAFAVSLSYAWVHHREGEPAEPPADE
jgi:hypothetical protein